MKIFKKVLKILLIVILAILLVVGGYFAYVFIAYHRLGDMDLTPTELKADAIAVGTEYKIVSYNIGFGAYEADYGFFMDGGSESRAWSKERLDANLKNIKALLDEQKADLYLMQEVDIDSTRTYGVDERTYFNFENKASVFAQNYDSPYLFYPVTKPHGASKSGIMTFSSFPITSAKRFELPIEGGFRKLLDLDRCYSKSRIPTADGKELVLYNFHLSAYTADGTIATEQLNMILADIDEEYAKGNYCIAGGDFNKDLLGDSSKYFGISGEDYSWAKPIPEGTFDGHNVRLVAPLDESKPVPSCRNADGPYTDTQFVITIDGFLVTPNVTVGASNVIDVGFAYSDHNPVFMTFTLGEAQNAFPED